MSLARLTLALLIAYTFAQAQQIPKYEPDAQIHYNRITDVTWYSSDSILLSGIGVSMEIGFSCVGDTGESPCTPSGVTLVFKNLAGHSIDYSKRDLFVLAGRDRFQGRMKVTYSKDLGDYTAEIPISLAMLRQLAKSENVEMQVGSGQATLSKEAIATIGSFYNMAVLNEKQRTPPKGGRTRRKNP